MAGTYVLPEAQLDRFLFKLIVDFPDRDAEIAILSRGTLRPVGEDATPLTSVMTREALQQGHALVDAIRSSSSWRSRNSETGERQILPTQMLSTRSRSVSVSLGIQG